MSTNMPARLGRPGVGTVLYALAIGPLAHYFIPRLEVPPRVPNAGVATP